MRWNCPHCQVSLFVADEQLNDDWSFSRCFECSGISVIRRSDVQAVKMDRVRNTAAPIATSSRPPHASPRQRHKAVVPPPAPRAALASEKPSASTPVSRKNLWMNIGLAVICLVSGSFLYQQGQRLIAASQLESGAVEQASATPNLFSRASTALTIAQNQRKQVTNSTPISDQIRGEAFAPIRPKTQELAKEELSRLIHVSSPRVLLRAGPGTNYKVLGSGDPQTAYLVIASRDQWLRIRINEEQAAWVREDLVNSVATPTENHLTRE